LILKGYQEKVAFVPVGAQFSVSMTPIFSGRGGINILTKYQKSLPNFMRGSERSLYSQDCQQTRRQEICFVAGFRGGSGKKLLYRRWPWQKLPTARFLPAIKPRL